MTEPETPSDTVVIDDLDKFVKILASWHQKKVDVLKHLLTLPEGMEIQLGDAPPFILNPDILKGVQFGVNLALMEMGKLPFGYELEDEPAEKVDASRKT